MRLLSVLCVLGALAAVQAVDADDRPGGPTDVDLELISDEIDALRARNHAIGQRLDDSDAEEWLSAERSSEIREIVGDILQDSSARSSLQTSNVLSGYEPGRGFFLKSADDSFSLHINGQVQFRWVLNHNNSGQDYVYLDAVRDGDPSVQMGPKTAWGASVRRAKVRFQGNVFDPSWTYRINGAFNTQGMFFFEEVILGKSFDNGMELRFGQMKAPFLREELVGSQNQLAVDRSLVNSFFNQDRSVGMTFGYKTENLHAQVYYGNGMRTAVDDQQRNTSWSDNPTRWSFAGRLEYKFAGDWDDFNSFTSEPGHETAVMVGVGAMGQEYNGNANLPGVLSLEHLLGALAPFPGTGFNMDAYKVYGVTADVSAKFGSVSLFTAFVWQRYSVGGDGAIHGTILGAEIEPSTFPDQNPWGFVAQAGYSVTDQIELFGRYSYAKADFGTFNFTPVFKDPAFAPLAPLLSTTAPMGATNLSVITIGANYFFNDNVKATIDWGINLESSMVGVGESGFQGLGWGPTKTGQEWVLRAQLQLLF